MDISLKKSRRIALLIAVILSIGLFIPCGSFGASEPNQNGADLKNLQPADEMGMIITGEKVRGNKGFHKDILCLTRTEMEQLKTQKTPENFGLGASWRENQRYSSYDNHGSGNAHYTIASGLDVGTVLDTVVQGGTDAVKLYWIYSSDTYASKIDLAQMEGLKYFAPGDSAGVTSAKPMIAFYKETVTGTKEPADNTAARLGAGEETFVYGQNTPTDDNNCHFIKKVNAVYVENPVTAIRTDNDKFRIARLKDVMGAGIYQTSYTFQANGAKVTHKLEGIPITKVLDDMDLTKYVPEYSRNMLELVSTDGKTIKVGSADIEKCFIAWGFTDDTVPSEKQTGQLSVYMPGTTEEDTVFYNLAKINVKDSSGSIVTAVPQKPSPAAPASFKAVKSSYNSIKLTWKKAADADSYRLYRYNAKTKAYKELATLPADATSYTDKNLATNTTYKYKIRSCVSVNGKAYPGSLSAEASAKPALNKGAVTKISKSGKTAVKITWKKTEGAKGYQVYRAVKKNGKYTKVATVKSGKVSYTDKKLKKGKTYYYKVRAYRTVSGKAQYGAFSAVKKIKR